PQASERHDMVLAGDPGIDFQANLGILSKSKALLGMEKKILELHRTEIRGGAATPVELHDRTRSIQPPGDPIDFLLELLNVRMSDLMVAVYYHVAAAKKAQAVTERKMHVERERALRLRGVRFLERLLQLSRAETVEPLRRGGIARVPGAGNVIPVDQFGGYSDGLGLEINGEWIAAPHRSTSTTNNKKPART